MTCICYIPGKKIREGIIKKLNKIIIGKTRLERNAIYYFYQSLFLLVVLTSSKRNTFQISMKFQFKKGKLVLKHYFLLQLMCYLANEWFLWTNWSLSFMIFFYIPPRRSKKITIIFFTFVTSWNTLPGACSDLNLCNF